MSVKMGPRAWRAAFYGVTGVLVVGLVIPGAANLTGSPGAVQTLHRLGYPAYFALLLGVAKLAAAGALLLPVGRTLREWAYAGVVFMLAAAAFSHVRTGDGAGEVVAPIGVLALTGLSYALWRRRSASSPAVPT